MAKPTLEQWRELAQLAGTMRTAQKTYFREKTTASLELSKSLERNFDARLKELNDRENAPPSLFD